MFGFDVEGFCQLQIRGIHIAGAVTDHQPIVRGAFPVGDAVIADRDALVVDLDLLAGFDVVVDHHLLAAANERSADLDGGQPVDVHVANEIALEHHG
jgi:hypothetical protein